MFNLLTEPLIRITTADGTCVASLPEVYAALMADEVDAFPALRPHQRHAWHAFLVQLGAMAMHRAGISEPPADAAEWVAPIRGLTPDWPDDEPWQAVVEDITKPAFLQPPARSAGELAEYKNRVATPDELDMLVTSKNHDLKSTVVSQADVDDWIFALIALQTLEGYGGSRNYGISRMPSGYGNRSAFSITPTLRLGGHVKRDIKALLEHRQTILDEYPVTNGGISLLWTVPWDGTKAEALLINQMEPFYIEVCRRIRLRLVDGKLEAIRANSLARRIVDIKGLTGDPWTPVGKTRNQKDTPPAFLGPRKFGYDRIVDGLFSQDWARPPLLTMTQYDRGTMQLVARGMVRGEGGTQGYHERIIPLRPKAVQIFGRPSGQNELEDIARERIEQIGKVQRILRYAISLFVAGGNRENIKDEHRDHANRRANQLTEIVDSRFFADLQDEFDVDGDNERKRIRKRWLRNRGDGVIDHASKILQAAEDALPCPTIHRYKARVNAEIAFWGGLRGSNGIPDAFEQPKEDMECPNNSQTPQTQSSMETQIPLFQ